MTPTHELWMRGRVLETKHRIKKFQNYSLSKLVFFSWMISRSQNTPTNPKFVCRRHF